MLDCTVSASTPGLATRTDTSTLLGLMFVARISDEVGASSAGGALDVGGRFAGAGHVGPHTASDWSTDAMLSTDAWLFGMIVGSAAGSVAAAPPVLAVALLDCVTTSSSPGLATRTETFTLRADCCVAVAICAAAPFLAADAASAAAEAVLLCMTAPLFPGLATRTVAFTFCAFACVAAAAASPDVVAVVSVAVLAVAFAEVSFDCATAPASPGSFAFTLRLTFAPDACVALAFAVAVADESGSCGASIAAAAGAAGVVLAGASTAAELG
jgi:hypothetical protein